MQWRKYHVEVLFWCRLVFHIEWKCEPTIAHHIHLESVTFCLVSDALLMNVSLLKYWCLFIHSQPSTKNPCISRHSLNMFEKWANIKVRVCYSWWQFEHRIMRRKTTFPLLVAEGCGWPKHTVDKRATLDWVVVGIFELQFYSWQGI